MTTLVSRKYPTFPELTSEADILFNIIDPNKEKIYAGDILKAIGILDKLVDTSNITDSNVTHKELSQFVTVRTRDCIHITIFLSVTICSTLVNCWDILKIDWLRRTKKHLEKLDIFQSVTAIRNHIHAVSQHRKVSSHSNPF